MSRLSFYVYKSIFHSQNTREPKFLLCHLHPLFFVSLRLPIVYSEWPRFSNKYSNAPHLVDTLEGTRRKITGISFTVSGHEKGKYFHFLPAHAWSSCLHFPIAQQVVSDSEGQIYLLSFLWMKKWVNKCKT